MQVKTILNRIEKHPSFVYEAVGLVDGPRLRLEVKVRARANARAKCSGCGRPAPGYDTLPERRFEFVPLWGIAVFMLYAMRRVACPRCGVKVESVPWATGKHRLTRSYAWFLARWAKRLSWKEVAEVFHTSWDTVFGAVCMAVEWGRAHQDLGGIEALGIDEIAWQRGHRYLTLVGVAPLSWTPDHCAEEVSRWQKDVPPTRRSTGARWCARRSGAGRSHARGAGSRVRVLGAGGAQLGASGGPR